MARHLSATVNVLMVGRRSVLLPPRTVVTLRKEACVSLVLEHRGIVAHLDLKSSVFQTLLLKQSRDNSFDFSILGELIF